MLSVVLTGGVEISAHHLVHTLYLFLYLKNSSAVGCLTSCMVRVDVFSASFLKILCPWLLILCFSLYSVVFIAVEIVPNIFIGVICG